VLRAAQHPWSITLAASRMPDPEPNIPLRAYQLWDAAGRPEGRSEEFYFRAEEEFRQLLESQVLNPADD
jgi:hypothetical protein